MKMNCRSFFAALTFAAFATPVAAQQSPAPAAPPAAAPAAAAPAAARAAAPAPAHAAAHPAAAHKKVAAKHAAKPKADLKDVIYLDTKDGRVTIKLRPDLAPKNVAQVEELTKQGFYNGLPFHRVIAGFMAQTGDPTGTGGGGSKLPNLPAEFTTKAHFVRGTLGMARTDDPNSANSQFFICFAPASYLDGKYTIIGEVTSGMDVVDKIKKGEGQSGMVTDPDKIVKMQLASDAGPEKKVAKTPTKKTVKKIAKKTEKKPAAAAAAAAPAPAAAAPAPAAPAPAGAQ